MIEPFVWGGVGFILGAVVAVWWSRGWMTRFRYEAQHWNKVVDDWREAYYAAHKNSKELRNEVVTLHQKIAKLTVENCEVLAWVSRNVSKARSENDKSATFSTTDSQTGGSTTSTPSATSKSTGEAPST